MHVPAILPMTSLWLLAAEEDESALMQVVDELASQHGTPRFHPHMTIVGDAPIGPEDWAGILPGLGRAVPALTIAVGDIVTSDLYFRSFYALFPAFAALNGLRTRAHQAIGMSETPFTPHVSLLYGPVAEAEKQASAAAVRALLRGRPVCFDRLALTNSANDVPIADWQILEIVALSGA